MLDLAPIGEALQVVEFQAGAIVAPHIQAKNPVSLPL
jgi:hypothetical protein